MEGVPRAVCTACVPARAGGSQRSPRCAYGNPHVPGVSRHAGAARPIRTVGQTVPSFTPPQEGPAPPTQPRLVMAQFSCHSQFLFFFSLGGPWVDLGIPPGNCAMPGMECSFLHGGQALNPQLPLPSPHTCLTRRAATAEGKPCTMSTISLGRNKVTA